MVLVWSRYRYKGNTKNKLAREASRASRHGNYYRAIYPSASHGRYKGRVARSVAAYKRHGLN
jgi:hypothetical protein